jgi:hypothetical protein
MGLIPGQWLQRHLEAGSSCTQTSLPVLPDLGFDAWKKAEPSCRISSSVRLCWDFEASEGPKGQHGVSEGWEQRSSEPGPPRSVCLLHILEREDPQKGPSNTYSTKEWLQGWACGLERTRSM